MVRRKLVSRAPRLRESSHKCTTAEKNPPFGFLLVLLGVVPRNSFAGGKQTARTRKKSTEAENKTKRKRGRRKEGRPEIISPLDFTGHRVDEVVREDETKWRPERFSSCFLHTIHRIFYGCDENQKKQELKATISFLRPFDQCIFWHYDWPFLSIEGRWEASRLKWKLDGTRAGVSSERNMRFSDVICLSDR